MNCLIVGAGISGCIVARLLADKGNDVTIIEQRNHIAGNLYDYIDKSGIIVQKYGPHIFHTNSKSIKSLLETYDMWFNYNHTVTAYVNDKYIPVPFNFNSIEKLFDSKKTQEIISLLKDKFGYGSRVSILQLRQTDNREIKQLADYIYQNVFYTYTKKQWGLEPELLDKTLFDRVPVNISYDNNYFTDKYQMQPLHGYTHLMESILLNKNIKIILNTNAKEILKILDNKIYYNNNIYNGVVIYTGKLDELFDYKYGELPYRSLNFFFKEINASSYQPSPVVNYTISENFTRISEFSKITMQKSLTRDLKSAIICEEYPKVCDKDDIPYYPMVVENSRQKFELYKNEVDKIDNLYILGRLGKYQYINIDKAIEEAVELANKLNNNL